MSQRLEEKPLYELKAIALEELNLSKDDVRKFGNLTYKATWINAILDHQEEVKQLSLTQSNRPEISLVETAQDSPPAIKPVLSKVEVSGGDPDFTEDSPTQAGITPSEIINITPEESPEIWEILQPPTELEPESQVESTNYQVITDSPVGLEPVNTNKFFRIPKIEKLPGQDFFVRLFSPPKVSETSPLGLKALGLT